MYSMSKLMAFGADLPTEKYLNLPAVKLMAAAAKAEAQKPNVPVIICIMDESANLRFLLKPAGSIAASSAQSEVDALPK
jgi:uncharacterized protein GlcG (DUF336 family)